MFAAFGDQDALCALMASGGADCMLDCGTSTLDWLNAHCACDTGALFASYSIDFAGSDAYCCGDAECQAAVVTFYEDAGYPPDQVEDMLAESCIGSGCASDDDLPACMSDCPAEVINAFGDQDAFCALDPELLACMSDCDMDDSGINAHCACDTGALFASYSFDFAGSDAYCCGDPECQAAVVDFYVDSSGVVDKAAVEEYLHESCVKAGVSCECDDYTDKYFLNLYDTYGDGWEGNTLSIAPCDDDTTPYASGLTFDAGSSASLSVCLPTGVTGFVVVVGGGLYASEISFELLLPDGETTALAGSGAGNFFWGTCVVPTPSPSAIAPTTTPAPTVTLAPTTLDTVKVMIAFDATASKDISDARLYKLQVTMADSLKIEKSQIDDLAVTTVPIKVGGLTTGYTWSVNSYATGALSDLRQPNVNGWAAAVQAELEDPAFSAAYLLSSGLSMFVVNGNVDVTPMKRSIPTPSPTPSPTVSVNPSQRPTASPSPAPSAAPSLSPSSLPTEPPSPFPTPAPTMQPSSAPTLMPTSNPSNTPTALPSPAPSAAPTSSPSSLPSEAPSPLPTPAPEAGVTVGGPEHTTLNEEDGTATTTFTIVLDTVPLSPVNIAFLSSPSTLVAASPASVVFDYTNFGTPVIVTITAVANDIDHGEELVGSLVFAVSSSDSEAECAAVSGRPCGQAAAYDGFEVAPIDLTVIDDDEAGVTLSTAEAAATYDNYGDALGPATYTLVLNSEPRADVTVAVGGLGPYAVASPAAVTFSPANWSVPVQVSVAASAPSADRPVCHSGNRYCARLSDGDGRVEAASHAVSSSDDLYAGVAVGGVDVSCSVVYDASDLPRVTLARFGNLLNSMSIYLDRDSNQAGGLAGTFACSSIFDITALEATTLFGPTSYCTFTSKSTVKVVFSRGATVVPGDQISIKDRVLQTSADGASLFTMNETLAVDQPEHPTTPNVYLSASSSAVGRCDALTLDGSGSSGSGGREMKFTWAASAASAHSIANLTLALDAANAANGGAGSFKVEVESWEMVPGSTFAVSLTAENFLGNSHTSTITVTKLDTPAPLIKIQGPHRVTSATHSRTMTLAATAELPSMTCVAFDLASAKMSFKWFEDSGLFTGPLAGTSKNPRELVVAAGQLQALQTLSFRVVGFMTDTPSINNSATVEVVVAQQALRAVVAGGASRQVGRDASFTLDGSGSNDPDEDTATPFAYAWACAAVDSGADCSGLALAATATVNVPSSSLSVGTYRFTLMVSKGSRTASASSSVEVVAGSPPAVAIADLGVDKFNTDGGFLSLAGTVSSPYATTLSWVATVTDVAKPFLKASVPVASVAGNTALLPLASLTAGYEYTFRLTATDSDGQAAASTVLVVMNEAPGSGSLAVSPAAGFALETVFEFAALDWVDQDMPFLYVFGTVNVLPDGSLDQSVLLPFGDGVGDALYNVDSLSAGANVTGYSVGCYVVVTDRFNAMSDPAFGTAMVRNKPLTTAQLFNISDAKTSAALDAGNADASKQVLAATTEGMKSSKEATARRRSLRRSLLATPQEEAEALRASVVANLWSTYAITTVTESNIASLLNVLVGAVDTPSEVDDATAASALSFVTTILTASQAAGVGVSAAGADLAAACLTNLFATGPFAPTSADAYTSAAGALEVVRLVSANQLAGGVDGVGYALDAADVDLMSFRAALATLGTALTTLALSDGGVSADTTSAVTFSAAAGAEASAALVAGGVASDALVDLKVATLATNVYAKALEGTAGSDAAVNSRLDQTGDALTGNTLLRSLLTVVEVAAQDSSGTLSLSGLVNPVEVALGATVPFTVDTAAYLKVGKCTENGAVIDLECPLTDDIHTCDWDSYGNGGKYHFHYECPMVVPTCLWWDEAVNAFSSEGCAVNEGYTATAVTCSCTHLTTFVLGADATAGKLNTLTTAEPTSVPVPVPTALPIPTPTMVPVPAPSPVPIPAPTQAPQAPPTLAPTTWSTSRLQVSFDVLSANDVTNADRTTIKSKIAAAIVGVEVADLLLFSVTSAQTSRRLDASRQRRLATYTWHVAFDLVRDLALPGSPPNQQVYAQLTEDDLNDLDFRASVRTIAGVTQVLPCTAVVDHTKTPSPEPTMLPVPGPTMLPVPEPTVLSVPDDGGDVKKKKNDDDDGDFNAASAVGISVLVCGSLVFLGLLYMAVKYRQKQHEKDLAAWMSKAMTESDNDGLGGGIQMKPKARPFGFGGGGGGIVKSTEGSAYDLNFSNPMSYQTAPRGMTRGASGAMQPFRSESTATRPADVTHVMSVEDLELQLSSSGAAAL